MAFVAVFEVQVSGERFSISGNGPWLLGRSDDADIAFPSDRYCSRRQAHLTLMDGQLVLRPIEGASVLAVNGRATLTPLPLQLGDTIRFGSQLLTLSAMADRRLTGRKNSPEQERPTQTVMLVDKLTIARTGEAAESNAPMLFLDHPTVSRRHARFTMGDRGVAVTDLGSTNGTWINGRRVAGRARLVEGDEITVGVFTLAFDGRCLTVRAYARGEDLTARSISKCIQARNGPLLFLLKGVNLRILPGELICIIGASGSGKSSLMNIISGRSWPSSGSVLLGNVDIHINFPSVRQDIAYVTQADELHDTLTLRSALEFAARLQLPRDLNAAKRADIIFRAAESVGLAGHLDTRIENLSGGQKKRASLAREILGRPAILFLDEITSGLDEKTDREIMALLKRMAQQGMTIVCVTHSLTNIEEFADRVAVLQEGRLLFAGSPAEALRSLGIRKLGEVFDSVAIPQDNGLPPREEIPPNHFLDRSDTHRKTGLSARAWLRLAAHQLTVLTQRNFAVLTGDRRSLLGATIQSCAIGALLGYAYNDLGSGFQASNSQLSMLLVIGIVCLWIGCAMASKAIVGELTIFRREHDVNLSTFAFVASKFITTGTFAVAQIAMLLLLFSCFVEAFPPPLITQCSLAAMTALAGVSIGLTISSVANTRDQASVLVPLALAPQLILGSGLVANLSSIGIVLAKLFIPAYWSREAMNAALLSSQGNIVRFDVSTQSLVPATAEPISVAVGALSAQIVLWFVVALAVMYWRYSRPTKHLARRHSIIQPN